MELILPIVEQATGLLLV